MIAADQTQSWIDQHSAVVSIEADWLNTAREKALSHFEEVGLPGIRDEQWRYTNLRALKSHNYSVAESRELLVELPTSDNPRLVFVDGILNTEHSTALNVDGVSTLSSALKTHNSLVEAHFGQALPKEQHGFTALNTAYAQDGFVVQIGNNANLVDVLEVFFVSQSPETVSHTRNLIICAANTKCTVVERHIGNADAIYLSNSVTEIFANDNAHVDHYKIQQESDEAFHIGGVFINQQSSSNVKSHSIVLSGLVTRNDVNTNLLGEGAHMEMNGLVLGSGRQHIDNHTEVNHVVPNCTSDEYYKTILDDKSRSVFRGRIIVAEDAQLTNADQQNNNLLLSRHAESDSKPQLEIYADDVKCSHGCTVGQLDASSLFYLKSRGIDAESARGLLTFAFANEVIDRIQVDSVKSELTKIIAGELLSGLEDLV